MAKIVELGGCGHLRGPQIPGAKMVRNFSRSGKMSPDDDLDQDLPGPSVEAPSGKDLPSDQKDSPRRIREGSGSRKKEPSECSCHQRNELPVEKEPPVAPSGDESRRSDKIRPLVGLGEHLRQEGGRMLKVPVHDRDPLSSGFKKSPDKRRAKAPFILPVEVSDVRVLPGESFENRWSVVGAVVDKENLEVVTASVNHRVANGLGKDRRVVALVVGRDDDCQQ